MSTTKDKNRRLQLCLKADVAQKLEEIALKTKLKYVAIISNGIEKEYEKMKEGAK
jgi:hypothetical protein